MELPHSIVEGRLGGRFLAGSRVLPGRPSPLAPPVLISRSGSGRRGKLTGLLHFADNGPDETTQLAGNRRHRLWDDDATPAESSKAAAESVLGFPSDRLYGGRSPLSTALDHPRSARRKTIGPGALDEHPPQMGIAGPSSALLGDASLRWSIRSARGRRSPSTHWGC